MAYFQWSDWLKSTAIKNGKRPVFINLDETSIARSWPQARGHVVRPHMWVSKHRPPKAKASRAEYRGTVTGVVIITHDAAVQKVLPQIYIGNGHIFQFAELAAVAAEHPQTVKFWREKSSWTSVALMKKILKMVAESLAAFPDIQPILEFDAASIHIHRDVLEESIRSRLWLLCVPAKTTWLLQLLDTHVFARYKSFLHQHWRHLIAGGSATFRSWINLLGRVSVMFLQSIDWTSAFIQDGLVGHRDQLSKRLSAYLGDRISTQACCAAQPTSEQVALCLPQRSRIHYQI